MQAISVLFAAALTLAAPVSYARSGDSAMGAAHPEAAAPVVPYESSFADYIPRQDVGLTDWREANDAAGAGGGHGAHAGHSSHDMHQGHDMGAMGADMHGEQGMDHSMHMAPSSSPNNNEQHDGHRH